MELSFVWVEEFRNIRDQSFNLSSKYELSYNTDDNWLEINDNAKFIPEFFGGDITNVTGIVGENGAG